MLMDATSELNHKNKLYLKALKNYIWEAYQQDTPENDITTKNFLGPSKKKIQAYVKANQAGTLSGMEEAKWFMEKIGVRILSSGKTGQKIKKGDIILKIEGDRNKILGAERTLLNLLQRMSGIATKTRKMSEKISKSIKLLATRKTLWGLLDKKAVSDGGGGTHRLNLSDAILIKDNHIALSENFKDGFFKIFAKSKFARFIEIEIESKVQMDEFLKTLSSLKKKTLIKKDKIIVMLDNFKPLQIKKYLPILNKAGVMIELSGGINEKNISQYNIPGIAGISSSAMTMSAQPLDLSMEMILNK